MPSLIIKLQLRELAQLFNSMDPSPFQDRDLDPKAEEFIIGSAREAPHAHTVELMIHVTKPVTPDDRAADVEQAVQHYFVLRAEVKQRELRALLKRGRMSLTVGLVFLAGCLGISELLATLGQGTLAAIVRESLTIGGWVAMWRPLEIYLYDWWPLRDDRRLLERLSRMSVRLIGP